MVKKKSHKYTPQLSVNLPKRVEAVIGNVDIILNPINCKWDCTKVHVEADEKILYGIRNNDPWK